MTNKFKLIFLVILFIFVSSSNVFSADLFYRFTHNDQNLLIIGKIKELNDNKVIISVKHNIISDKDMNVNKPKSFRDIPKKVTVINNFIYSGFGKTIVEGESNQIIKPKENDYILISLDKQSDGLYKCKWGAYKISSSDYKNLKILHPNNVSEGMKGHIAAIEYFVNSNGKYSEFSFDKNKVYVNKTENEKVQIYPKSANSDLAVINQTRKVEKNNKLTLIIGVSGIVIILIIIFVKLKNK